MAYARLLLMCAVYAAGATAAYVLDAASVAMWVGLALAAAAYVFTQDLDRPSRGGRGGGARYWRGRRIDDDDGPRRLN